MYTLTQPQLLLRFTFQVMNPSHPFFQRTVGFYLHDNMTFRVERRHAGSNSPILSTNSEYIAASEDEKRLSEQNGDAALPRNLFDEAEQGAFLDQPIPQSKAAATCAQDYGMCSTLENVDLMNVSV